MRAPGLHEKLHQATHADPASKSKKVGDPTTPCPPKKGKVVKITAKILATRSLHPPVRRIREIKKLKSSTSADESLSGNKPVILVRGCNVLRLTAETSPAKQPVTWEVKPNENDNTAPSFTQEKGNTIKLFTGQTGSFSVIAHLDDTKVVWNVVFVFVDVRVGTTKVNHTESFAKGQTTATATRSEFAAGQFARGDNAMETTVRVILLGGGADGKLGVEKIKLGSLQDGTADTLQGHYDSPPGGGTCTETVFALPKSKPVKPAPTPFIDAEGPDAAADEPVVPADEGGGKEMCPVSFTTPSMIQVKAKASPAGAKGKRFEVYMGDSPVGAFDRKHPKTKAFLTSITGVNAFRTAIASVSKDAPQQINAHAVISWQEDYSGTVAAPPAAVATYTPAAGTHITSGTKFKLIAAKTGGTDAFDAGFECFAPRFNESLEDVFAP